MADKLTFIVLEGLLWEGGDFELRRGYEDTHAEDHLRFGSNARGVMVSLVDEDGLILASVLPTIHFPLVCAPDSTQPGVGLLRAAVALSPKARRIELRANARLVFTGDIAAERPTLRNVGVSLDGVTARVTFDIGTGQPDLQLLAGLPNGRRLQPRGERVGNEFRVDLQTLEGMGQANFIVEATSDFRTERASTGGVPLPPASIHGRIIEPAPDSEWPFGWRGSLIGSLCDRNGRRLEWSEQQVYWVLDGKRTKERRPLVACQLEESGGHQFELIHDIGDGQIQVLDQVRITVVPQTKEQKEYEALISAHRAKRASRLSPSS